MKTTTAEQLRAWRDAGRSQASIAKELGCNASLVSNACRLLGIKHARAGSFDPAIVVPLLRSGMKVRDVAVRLGVHVRTVESAAARAISAGL